MVEIHGSFDARFERVRDTFAAAFESGAEIGGAISVVVEGERVVDLFAGYADAEHRRPWKNDTLVNVFSTTKGMTALCAHLLADRGELEFEAPVARYWPEFAAAGKEAITVRQLISHQAGLPAVRENLPAAALFDWEAMAKALAAEAPWWEPGTQHGYHAVTFGWLVGEVVRRISGKSLGQFFRDEIAAPLGADFFIGCPPELDARIADLVQGPVEMGEQGNLLADILKDPTGMTAKAFNNPPILGGDVSMSREWRAAEIPAANGHASASGIATIYGALANAGQLTGRDRIELLSPAAIDLAREEQACGKDAVLSLTTRLAMGFMLAPAEERCGPNDRAFNHAGAGGSLGYCDPEASLGIGYVMNCMHFGPWLVDPRARALVDATHACPVGGDASTALHALRFLHPRLHRDGRRGERSVAREVPPANWPRAV